ncbi:CaiB/BaiF CoA transferase family protein [Alicyclobacillus dauci]|uniref:CoA transferase n=1 Tax=Alicyclobacillus dauci TaxID=1475485 RepID=A0ABY6Z0E3_9BACL|nr:CaiB/BaiF CoA-transferase family protein [Alicyclobacillus dauci]WAH36189.1 CoA transferase [Alicyclobacillus dauci]
MGLPLDGITVIDFSQIEAGPLATLLLSDFGARVIKVERFPDGDLLRSHYGHEYDGVRIPFASLNRGKESLAVSIKTQQGLEIVKTLLSMSDVMVHNFRPGVMERLGLGWDQLKEEYPALIYAEISGYGSKGPMVKEGGQDVTAQALSGLMRQNSDPTSDEARAIGYPVSDFGAGMSLLCGILMALIGRFREGKGSYITTSLIESSLFSAITEVTEAQMGYRTSQFDDPVTGVYKAKDGELVVMPIWRETAVSDFLKVIGLEEIVNDPRMQDLESRKQSARWVREQINNKVEGFQREELLKKLHENNLLCGPVQSFLDVAQHPQIKAIDPWATFETTTGETGTTIASPFTVDGYRRKNGKVPELGEQSFAILKSFGYSDEEIASFVQQNIVYVEKHH